MPFDSLTNRNSNLKRGDDTVASVWHIACNVQATFTDVSNVRVYTTRWLASVST